MFKKIVFALIVILILPIGLEAKTKRNSRNRTKKEIKKTVKIMPTDTLTKIVLNTSLGEIVVALYDDTPKHRDNIVKLAKEGYYDGTLFHRVIKSFMIQGGDGTSKNAQPGQHLGSGDLDYTVEAELRYPAHFHKRGALAAARTADQVNPEKRSSGSQFYIVTGKVYSKQELDKMTQQKEYRAKQNLFQSLAAPYRKDLMKLQAAKDTVAIEKIRQKLISETEAKYAENPASFTQEQIDIYSTIGGTPHLDGEYTVYGEVVKGMEIVDKIEQVETDGNDRPKEDIKIISTSVIEKK